MQRKCIYILKYFVVTQIQGFCWFLANVHLFDTSETSRSLQQSSLTYRVGLFQNKMQHLIRLAGQSGDDSGDHQWSRCRRETCRKRKGWTQHEPAAGPSKVREQKNQVSWCVSGKLKGGLLTKMSSVFHQSPRNVFLLVHQPLQDHEIHCMEKV